MYLAYALTVAYLPNFSLPIAFTCMVHQKFSITKIFLCTILDVPLCSVGEGEKRKNIPSKYVWVHPSMRLAAMDDGAKEKAASKSGLPIEKPPPSSKGSIFSRLGNQMEDASKGKQGLSLNAQPEAKQKYSPRRPVSI